MTVNELIEKLEKIKIEGYGNEKVVLGAFGVDGTFYPQSYIHTCYSYSCKGKQDICGLTTIGGPAGMRLEV